MIPGVVIEIWVPRTKLVLAPSFDAPSTTWLFTAPFRAAAFTRR